MLLLLVEELIEDIINGFAYRHTPIRKLSIDTMRYGLQARESKSAIR